MRAPVPDGVAERVARATVTVVDRHRQAVHVPGRWVITVADGIPWNVKKPDGTREVVYESLDIGRGEETIEGEVFAVEPYADILVFAAVDEQFEVDSRDAFDDWCDRTPALMPWAWTPKPNDTLRVHLWTHDRRWVAGTAKHVSRLLGPGLWVAWDEPVHPWSTGAPVIDDRGRFVGLAASPLRIGQSRIVVPSRALPGWLLAEIGAGSP